MLSKVVALPHFGNGRPAVSSQCQPMTRFRTRIISHLRRLVPHLFMPTAQSGYSRVITHQSFGNMYRLQKSQISKLTQTVNTQSPISNLQSQINISPNPFTKLTTIRYAVPVSGKVSIRLYNTTGKLVETLINEYTNAGSHSLTIDNQTLKITRGVYFLRYEDMQNKPN